MMDVITLCERGYVPDALIRFGVRRLLRQRLRSEFSCDRLLESLKAAPIAIETEAANRQHYEVPAEFFRLHLGPRLKYSCGLYPTGGETLAEAEDAMLALYAERAYLADGQRILDLGCGWGSLSLWLAERFPRSQIVGLSNSTGQRTFIEARAHERGLQNLRVVTGNVATFDFATHAAGFDRVLSIEMFEHLRNYRALLAKVRRWLKTDGRLFVHLFAHRTRAYPFEDRDRSDWMARHFFTGGIMPSYDLLLRFQDDMQVRSRWWLPGTHYARTAGQWLTGMEAHRPEILSVFRSAYGEREAVLWVQRWRMFYIAVAELFGYRNGTEWGVGHYVLAPRP